MKKVLKYLTLALIVANYLLCLFNLLRGEFTHSLNEFTIGTLFTYIYFSESFNDDEPFKS
jgi:hypothetical protein